MPNGGIPMQMVLRPKQSDVVVHCRAGLVQVFHRTDWDRDRAKAEPIFAMDASEAAALAGFVRYWVGARPPIDRSRNVDSEYDW